MISVIMGVHNIDTYLSDAVKSIMNQTIQKFELIIVANGPKALEIEQYISKNFQDDRIIVIKSSIPQLSYALNLGIDNSKHDYIARMDSDDIAHPERLERQLHYLQSRNLDLVGCSVNLINEDGESLGTKKAIQGKKINKWLPFKSTFVHPSILCKKSLILSCRGYNSGFNSEDYDLWLRMKRYGVKWDNMEDILLSYRIHQQASQRRLLGYAECAGYAVREFLLKKNISNFFAIFIQFIKALIRPDRSKKD